MLSNPIRPSRDVDEGTVVQVDPIRLVCKVRTLRGQMLPQVRWLVPFGGSSRAGDRITPSMGDRVMLEHGLGNPVIIGFFPRLQGADGATPLAISSGDLAIDTGNYSSDSTYVVLDQNKPKDMVQGDRLLSTAGGALLALLRGGSILIRSSRVSEIFLSKFTGLIRVVSRNWEHFTDVSSDVIRNFNGRVYRYVGYTRNFIEAKNEQYRLNFYFGDTSAAEQVKTAYHTHPAITTTDNNIYKEQIVSGTSSELMRRTLDITGNEEVWITAGTTFTRINSTGTGLKLSFNDQDFLEVNATHLHLERHDGAIVNLDSTGIQTSFSGGTVVTTSSSVVVTKGASTATIDAGQASLDSGGHFCHVTSAGVALG